MRQILLVYERYFIALKRCKVVESKENIKNFHENSVETSDSNIMVNKHLFTQLLLYYKK